MEIGNEVQVVGPVCMYRGCKGMVIEKISNNLECYYVEFQDGIRQLYHKNELKLIAQDEAR